MLVNNHIIVLSQSHCCIEYDKNSIKFKITFFVVVRLLKNNANKYLQKKRIAGGFYVRFETHVNTSKHSSDTSV